MDGHYQAPSHALPSSGHVLSLPGSAAACCGGSTKSSPRDEEGRFRRVVFRAVFRRYLAHWHSKLFLLSDITHVLGIDNSGGMRIISHG